jgi:hypothetical protein
LFNYFRFTVIQSILLDAHFFHVVDLSLEHFLLLERLIRNLLLLPQPKVRIIFLFELFYELRMQFGQADTLGIVDQPSRLRAIVPSFGNRVECWFNAMLSLLRKRLY